MGFHYVLCSINASNCIILHYNILYCILPISKKRKLAVFFDKKLWCLLYYQETEASLSLKTDSLGGGRGGWKLGIFILVSPGGIIAFGSAIRTGAPFNIRSSPSVILPILIKNAIWIIIWITDITNSSPITEKNLQRSSIISVNSWNLKNRRQ